MPRLEPLSGCQKRKLAQSNKEKLEAVLSKTPKLTTLFASRNNIVAENPDENITLQSIEASNQENQEVTSGGQTTELAEVSSLESETSNKQDSEGDNDPKMEIMIRIIVIAIVINLIQHCGANCQPKK